MKLQALKARLDQVYSYAVAEYPNECCGLMIGRQDDGIFTLTRIVASPNISTAKSTSFEIDPGLRIQLERELRGQDEMIIGLAMRHRADASRLFDRQLKASSQVPCVEALEYSVARFSKKFVCSIPLSISSIQGNGLRPT